MQDYISSTENYKGYTINIVQDSTPQNPRTEFDNMATMVCWHSRYSLGDMDGKVPISKQYDEPDYLFAEIAGIDRDSLYCMSIYDKHGADALTQYLLTQARTKAIVMPLYLYDHSGITISTGKFSCAWDSGCIGFIYLTFEKARKEYGYKQITMRRKAKIATYLEGEVETYDNYLTGNVWGYEVVNAEGEVTDSCYGYFGDEGVKTAIEEARDIIDYNVRQSIIKHLQQLKAWIINKVPLHIRKPLIISY